METTAAASGTAGLTSPARDLAPPELAPITPITRPLAASSSSGP